MRLSLILSLSPALAFGFLSPCRHSKETSLWTYHYEDVSTPVKSRYDGEEQMGCGTLSLTLQELSDQLGGSGRAAVVWDCLRAGIDPNLYFYGQDEIDTSDDTIANAWISETSTPIPNNIQISSACQDDYILGRRKGQGLGMSSWKKLQKVFGSNGIDPKIYTIENSIASLSHMKVSSDGTTKLLLKMVRDGLEVESVIIPWTDKGFSTLCVSSQVGCRQGCTFCATGREYMCMLISRFEPLFICFCCTFQGWEN